MRDWRAYYYLTKPGIIRGNLLTAAAGFVVASGRQMDFGLLVATLLGTALIIGSACMVNNCIDHDIDAKMERTKGRATAAGKIPLKTAALYAAVLGLVGFAILALWVNWLTVLVGLVGYVDYVSAYTLSKRRTWHATLIGSICGATPVVAGYTAVTDHLDAGALILFLILVFWQMPHFYAIALRRLDEYKTAGIPVLPAVRGRQAAKTQIIAYMAGFLVAVVALGLFGYAGGFYTVVMSALAVGWLAVGLSGWKMPDSRRWATQVFLYSLILLPAFLVVTLFDTLLTG